MASKRNMYRPAQVQENVGRPKQRKTIAQGRLITNGGHTQGSVPASGSQPGGVLSQGHLNSSHMSNVSGNVSALHQSQLSNASMNNSQLHHTSLVQGRLEESLFSPRQQVPQVSEARTPNRGPPAISLDLTDSEAGDEIPETRSHYQKPDEVLCIDASRQTVNPDVSQVDIRIGVDKSPVRIVCHSPSRIKHTLRQDNAPAHGLPLPNIEPDTENLRQSKHRTPVIIKEKITDDHIDPHTAVQSIPMSPSSFTDSDRRVLQSLPTTYPQHNYSDSGGSDLGYMEKFDDRLSVASDDSIKEKPQKTRAPQSMKKEKKTERPETAKKKKAVRIIPSRYMQAADTKVKASLSARMEKSSIDRSKGSRSIDCPPSAKKSVRKTVPLNRQEKRREMERPSTPDSVASSTGGKTSTPTMDISAFSLDDIDASAIHPEVSLLAGSSQAYQQSAITGKGRTRSRIKQDLKDDLMGQSILSNVSICNQSTVSSKPKQKRDLKSLQHSLDLKYMHNLQWAFLEAKAKKTLHEQEKQAMAQIYGVHEKVEALKKLVAEKQQQYARLKHTNTTDHLVEVQRQCLAPVVNNLPLLQKHYSNLAYALDTTRHQIPTTDIYLPDNEDQFQAELVAQLLESERLLGEINAVTREKAPNIVAMGTAMVTMDQAVDKMENELKKSRELLAATEALTIQECCLRTQEIQSVEVELS